MTSHRHPFHYALLALCLVHLFSFCWQQIEPTVGIAGLLYPDGTPVGGDFINLWSSARLMLEGRVADIYAHQAFMDYEVGLVGGPIGFRVWAYPPHSLLLVWPFGLLDYFPALAIWSVIGVLALSAGCRRTGLDWMETAIVLLSPASVLCLYYGQTGNLATGLLLLALGATRHRSLSAVGAAALLTVKPQMGLLLPLAWLVEKRWWAIVWTGVAACSAMAISLVLFGPEVFWHYLNDTLPALSGLEKYGTGSFTTMIPSMFMSLRLLLGDGDLALQIHGVLVIPILGLVIWKLFGTEDRVRRIGVVLVGTALITPYLHNYDLTMLTVGAILVLRRFRPGRRGELAVCGVVALCLALPKLVVLLNQSGWPLSPLIILPLLLLS